jgi:transcription antitermination protein NusB
VSARRIARELAVIVLPQLSKDKKKLEQSDIGWLITKAVAMLCDYAKQNLSEADAVLERAGHELTDIEVDHPENVQSVEQLSPVNLTTGQLKTQVVALHRAINLIAEALDMPALLLQNNATELHFKCKQCGEGNTIHSEQDSQSDVKAFLLRLISTYLEHRTEIDEFIKHAKSKWRVSRMVSIDRDILRLACTEAFYMADIPISVCINEAVDLCHRFADEKAAKFVNGILGDLSREARYFRAKGTFMERSADDLAGEPDEPIDDKEETALVAD